MMAAFDGLVSGQINDEVGGRDFGGLISGLDKAGQVISDLVIGRGGGPCSLVEGAKSLTEGFSGSLRRQHLALPHISESGTSARLSYREWSGEYRLRCVSELSFGKAPPAQSGDRYTSTLSARGVEAIQSSCDFMHKQGDGYRTFITLTVSENNRKLFYSRRVVSDGIVQSGEQYKRTISKIWRGDIDAVRMEGAGLKLLQSAEGDYCAVEYTPNYVGGVLPDGPYCAVSFEWCLTVSKEVSRFVNSLGAMRRRGWVPKYSRSGVVKVAGVESYCPIQLNHEGERLEGTEEIEGKLPYVWVAECPVNSEGDPNPHVHLLMSWSIPWRLFPPWAKRIEAIWGLGFAKIEKLRDSEKSGYYMAKAAGYVSKAGAGSDQGTIRGNRYGLASVSRAPGWVQVGVWSWGILGHVIEQAREAWLSLVGPMRSERDVLQGALSSSEKVGKWKKRQIQSRLYGVRKKIKQVSLSFGRYTALFKTSEALSGFVDWAKSCGWSMSRRPSHPWLAEFRRQLGVRRDRLIARSRSVVTDCEWNSIFESASHWFDRWDSLDAENLEV